MFGLKYWDTVQNEMTILTDMLFTICVNEMQFNSNRYSNQSCVVLYGYIFNLKSRLIEVWGISGEVIHLYILVRDSSKSTLPV